ncbi:MAG TPA: tripartite tricarboxylate transporter substrate-binding protein [Hyphomicrobiaceae bacterium]|nr:tripartite tricarboxylate transporter substrate-binding protein [Hyphomicrobiaceae bacterium]
MLRRLRAAFALGSALALALVGTAHAQDWPSRPLTMVVPFAAGGPVDTIGRILGARLSEILGQQVVIENVGGAGGMIGASRVAKAAPDGYVFLFGTNSVFAFNQTIYKKPLYDTVADFAPVALFADSARILIARKDFPASSLAEFNAHAKSNQAKLQYGSAGHGSGAHVCAALLDAINGTKIAHVPYRGTAQAMQDLIGGRLDFICEQISTAVAQIEGGTVKGIAVLGPGRVSVLPDLATAKELGIAELDCNSWSALMLPKGTPDAIVRRLAQASNEAVETASVRERLERAGVTIPQADRRSPEYLAEFVKTEITKWAAVIRAAGITAD